MTALRPTALREQLRGSYRVVVKELAAFGVVGAVAFVIDVGLFTWLAAYGALKAKTVSTLVSTTFAYFGNRHLSFSHRARTGLGREALYFFGINLIALAFSLLVIALFVYPLGFDHDSTTVLAANLATIAMGTAFRFWSYKRFVFLHPDRVHRHDVDIDEELAE